MPTDPRKKIAEIKHKLKHGFDQSDFVDDGMRWAANFVKTRHDKTDFNRFMAKVLWGKNA